MRLVNSTGQALVDPFLLAKQQQSLQGKIAISAMVRLEKLLAATDGEVVYAINFATDLDGRAFIKGELSSQVTMCCQRCLQLFKLSVRSDFLISPVLDDIEAKDLPDEYEPVSLQAGKLDVAELIEDELILVMPLMAVHAAQDADCHESTIQVETTDVTQEKKNPFQILQELKLKAEDK